MYKLYTYYAVKFAVIQLKCKKKTQQYRLNKFNDETFLVAAEALSNSLSSRSRSYHPIRVW